MKREQYHATNSIKSLSHELRSERVSKRMSARAKRAVRSKQMSEGCDRASDRASGPVLYEMEQYQATSVC